VYPTVNRWFSDQSSHHFVDQHDKSTEERAHTQHFKDVPFGITKDFLTANKKPYFIGIICCWTCQVMALC